MICKARGLAMAAAWAVLLGAGTGPGSAQEVAPPGPSPAPPSGPSLPLAPALDPHAPWLPGDAWADPLYTPPPGCFAALEVSLLGPHVKNRLSAPVMVDGFLPRTVRLPAAELDWTGSPRLELGYRLPEGQGEVLASYRFLATEGSDVLPAFDGVGPGFLKSRLDLHDGGIARP